MNYKNVLKKCWGVDVRSVEVECCLGQQDVLPEMVVKHQKFKALNRMSQTNEIASEVFSCQRGHFCFRTLSKL